MTKNITMSFGPVVAISVNTSQWKITANDLLETTSNVVVALVRVKFK